MCGARHTPSPRPSPRSLARSKQLRSFPLRFSFRGRGLPLALVVARSLYARRKTWDVGDISDPLSHSHSHITLHGSGRGPSLCRLRFSVTQASRAPVYTRARSRLQLARLSLTRRYALDSLSKARSAFAASLKLSIHGSGQQACACFPNTFFAHRNSTLAAKRLARSLEACAVKD